MSSLKSDFYDIRLPHLSTKELRCQHLDSELMVNGIAAVECGISTVVDQGSSKRRGRAVEVAFRYFCREFRNQVVPYDRKALSGPDEHRAYLWVDKHEYVWHHHKKVYPVIGACCFHLREYKGTLPPGVPGRCYVLEWAWFQAERANERDDHCDTPKSVDNARNGDRVSATAAKRPHARPFRL